MAQPMPLSQQAQQTPPQPTRWDRRIREFLSIFWPWVFAALVIAVVGMTVSWGRSVENRLPESNTIQAAVSSGVREGLGAVNVRLDSHESRLMALEKAPVATASPKSEEEGFVATLKEWATGLFATREQTENIEKRVAVLEAKAATKPATASVVTPPAKQATATSAPAAPAVKQAPTQAPATAPATKTQAPVATKSATQAPASAPAPVPASKPAPASVVTPPAKQTTPATAKVAASPEERRLATLEAQVAANTEGVAANKAAIGQLGGRLTALEAQVAEILPQLRSLSGRIIEPPPTLGGYMPAREIGRGLGYEVEWTPQRKDDAGNKIEESVFFSKGGNAVVAAKFGSDNYYVSPCGTESKLFIAGRPPITRGGEVYLPERLFEELQTRAAKCS